MEHIAQLVADAYCLSYLLVYVPMRVPVDPVVDAALLDVIAHFHGESTINGTALKVGRTFSKPRAEPKTRFRAMPRQENEGKAKSAAVSSLPLYIIRWKYRANERHASLACRWPSAAEIMQVGYTILCSICVLW